MIPVLVAVGGALGALARYGLSGLVHRFASPYFPWGTATVNLVGCLLFGIVAGYTDERLTLDPRTRAFILIGLLGGFTTFSTFTFETLELLRDGQVLPAAGNVAGQLIVGLFALWLGFAGGRLL